MKEKVVLAFSGGLDTSFCAKYLVEEKGYEVHTAVANTGGFSAELILVEDVMQILSQLHKEQKPFHATAFKELFIGKSVNNSSFFGAVLVDQKVIRLHPQTTRLLEVMEDYELWPSRLESIPVSVAVDEVDTSQGNGKQPKKRQGKPMSIVHTEEVSPDADCTH